MYRKSADTGFQVIIISFLSAKRCVDSDGLDNLGLSFHLCPAINTYFLWERWNFMTNEHSCLVKLTNGQTRKTKTANSEWGRTYFMVTSLQTYFSLLVSYPVVICLLTVMKQERQSRKRNTKQPQEKKKLLTGVSMWGKCQNPVCGFIYIHIYKTTHCFFPQNPRSFHILCQNFMWIRSFYSGFLRHWDSPLQTHLSNLKRDGANQK